MPLSIERKKKTFIVNTKIIVNFEAENIFIENESIKITHK